MGQLVAIGEEVDALLPEHLHRVSGWQVYYYGLADREYTNTETFIERPAIEWEVAYEVQPPQVILLTLGLDDVHQPIHDTIAEQELALAQCFAHTMFSGQTHLYLPKHDLPQGAPLDCGT